MIVIAFQFCLSYSYKHKVHARMYCKCQIFGNLMGNFHTSFLIWIYCFIINCIILLTLSPGEVSNCYLFIFAKSCILAKLFNYYHVQMSVSMTFHGFIGTYEILYLIQLTYYWTAHRDTILRSVKVLLTNLRCLSIA